MIKAGSTSASAAWLQERRTRCRLKTGHYFCQQHVTHVYSISLQHTDEYDFSPSSIYFMTFIFPKCTVEEICKIISLVTIMILLGYLWHARGCGSGSKAGRPVIWRSVLCSPAPAACTSTCPWARLQTLKLLFHQCVHISVFCSWWADGTLHAGRVDKTGKVLHKCSPFTGNTRGISVTLNKVEELFFLLERPGMGI